MSFAKPPRRFGSRLLLSSALLGLSAAAIAPAIDPAAAAGMLAAAQRTVTCATSGKIAPGCVTGSNTSSGIGVLGASNTGTGVRGSATTGTGAVGFSQTGYGIFGQTTSGAAGVAGNSPTTGVSGFVSGNGNGVVGSLATTSNGGYGVYGHSETGVGVGAFSNASFAVATESNAAIGIVSQSDLANAVAAFSGSTPVTGGNPAVWARGDARAFEASTPKNGFGLILTNSAGTVVFSVDGAGDMAYRGQLTSGAATRGAARVNTFSPKTTLPTLEDTGSAQLIGGTAAVRLDPTFAAAVDAAAGYRIFLTPRGDTRGLFVAAKTAGGFVVRESQGGRTTTSFDYRLLGTALGEAGQRMAVAGAAAAARFLPATRVQPVPAPPTMPAGPTR